MYSLEAGGLSSAKRGGPSPEPPAAPPGENFSFLLAPFRHFLCSISDRKTHSQIPHQLISCPLRGGWRSFLPPERRGKLLLKTSYFPATPRITYLCLFMADAREEMGDGKRRGYFPSTSRSSGGGSCCCPRISLQNQPSLPRESTTPPLRQASSENCILANQIKCI